MTPGQRRILWLVCFGMAYIFCYEASGRPLVWESNAPEMLQSGVEARRFFWTHIGYGAFFAVFGVLLTLVLKSRTRPAPYALGDGIALALGLGALIGTVLRSAVQAGVW
jgi:uncharacterized oligopeptide transporter (OPT) family protein